MDLEFNIPHDKIEEIMKAFTNEMETYVAGGKVKKEIVTFEFEGDKAAFFRLIWELAKNTDNNTEAKKIILTAMSTAGLRTILATLQDTLKEHLIEIHGEKSFEELLKQAGRKNKEMKKRKK